MERKKIIEAIKFFIKAANEGAVQKMFRDYGLEASEENIEKLADILEAKNG